MRYIISFLLTSVPLIAAAEVPRVVTDIPPIHSITAQVMGDLGQPDLLLDRGADPHSYQLRPSQAASLANANLIFWVGPAMTPWMERALDSLSPDIRRIALLESEGTFRRAFGQTDAHDHEHGEEEALIDSNAADHQDDDHSGFDPHAWLDPENARLWADVIAAELARLDPENAKVYAANAQAAQAGINALDSEIARILAPVQHRPFVVFHDAYGYFTSHYGLTVAGSVALGDASSPGAARLRALSQTVADGGDLCLFPEGQHDPSLILQMAEGTQARIGAALDPEGSSIPPGPDAYATMMRALATTIADCLKN